MKTVITGGIASGKSQVASFIRKKGYPVIDADQVARQVVEPGTEGLSQVISEFGDAFLSNGGKLNRKKLRIHIATDNKAQQLLSSILFPVIRREINFRLTKLKKEGHRFLFVEAALAIESGSYKMYDFVLLVTAPENLRLERLLQRDGMDVGHAKSLMAKQMPDQEKVLFADEVLVNDKSLKDLEELVEGWLLKRTAG